MVWLIRLSVVTLLDSQTNHLTSFDGSLNLSRLIETSVASLLDRIGFTRTRRLLSNDKRFLHEYFTPLRSFFWLSLLRVVIDNDILRSSLILQYITDFNPVTLSSSTSTSIIWFILGGSKWRNITKKCVNIRHSFRRRCNMS